MYVALYHASEMKKFTRVLKQFVRYCHRKTLELTIPFRYTLNPNLYFTDLAVSFYFYYKHKSQGWTETCTELLQVGIYCSVTGYCISSNSQPFLAGITSQAKKFSFLYSTQAAASQMNSYVFLVIGALRPQRQELLPCCTGTQ